MTSQWCAPHPANVHPLRRDGRRHCGVLERVLRRQWDPTTGPPPASLVAAVDRLAMLPVHLASRLADDLEGIWLGHGFVPDLDHLGFLRGQARPGGGLWDHVPGALVGKTVVIGTGDHVSVSLVDHEIGHAIERLDEMADQPTWQTIMYRCRPVLQSVRYHDPYEWWAEAYAYCATGELAPLARMLSGDLNVMEMVWAYYRIEYGLEVPRKWT